MVESGVQCSDEIASSFNNIHTSKSRFAVYRFEGDSQIVLDKEGDRDASFDDFKAAIPDAECRYAVYDLEWEDSDKRKIRKVLFVVYIPDGVKTADKFMYSNAKTVIRAKIGHVNKDLTINDRLDLTMDYFREQF